MEVVRVRQYLVVAFCPIVLERMARPSPSADPILAIVNVARQ
jgi:hypothetical protein